MRAWRAGSAGWVPVIAAACALLLGLAVLITVSTDQPATPSAAPDSPSLSAAGTAGSAGQSSRESRSVEPSTSRARPSAADTSAPSTSSAAASTSVAASSSAPATPVVTFIGDSWTVGFGSETDRGYTTFIGETLGWEYHALGVGGSGYIQSGRGTPFAGRIEAAADIGADVVVVQGSLNDQLSDLQAMGPAALDTLSRLQAAVGPGTVILVIGAPYTPATDRAAIDTINDAIGGAATSLGIRFVDPAVENWTDPADPAIWADYDHPNDAGYRLIADRLSALLLETVGD
ncbi:SGNH/GDSL hydrolase family protein [Blastococcus litoris]|uniref:SGNH/GDSL hydrolase family protein n=1 Tax=Blastococcus litoris TaxID=2171622 RepID=UPI000E30A97F|nr:SGNH/GDSL hydrolase family protein [Blastococcus litoris]